MSAKEFTFENRDGDKILLHTDKDNDLILVINGYPSLLYRDEIPKLIETLNEALIYANECEQERIVNLFWA
jgi:hypothetical protein